MNNDTTTPRHDTRNDKGQFAAKCVQCGEAKSDSMNEKCDNCNAYDAGER